MWKIQTAKLKSRVIKCTCCYDQSVVVKTWSYLKSVDVLFSVVKMRVRFAIWVLS